MPVTMTLGEPRQAVIRKTSAAALAAATPPHRLPTKVPDQWLIIHGRAPGKDLAALRPATGVAEKPRDVLQQPQPEGCAFPDFRGSWRERSLTAMPWRAPASIVASAGARRMARGAGAPQPSHASGWSNSDIGRWAVNGPQAAHT